MSELEFIRSPPTSKYRIAFTCVNGDDRKNERNEDFGEFLTKLKDTREGDHTLPSRTMTLYASNLGNSSNPHNTNLPIPLASGPFCHRGHLAHDRRNNMLAANLYVRMLNQLGIETRSFGASTGALTDV